jgi:hypothetical protein
MAGMLRASHRYVRGLDGRDVAGTRCRAASSRRSAGWSASATVGSKRRMARARRGARGARIVEPRGRRALAEARRASACPRTLRWTSRARGRRRLRPRDGGGGPEGRSPVSDAPDPPRRSVGASGSSTRAILAAHEIWEEAWREAGEDDRASSRRSRSSPRGCTSDEARHARAEHLLSQALVTPRTPVRPVTASTSRGCSRSSARTSTGCARSNGRTPSTGAASRGSGGRRDAR